MDSGIVFIIFFALILVGILVAAIIYREQVGGVIADNKGLSILLVVFLVAYLTYQYYLYREYQKKKDMYQTKKATNTCPDYWVNVSASKDEYKCSNVKKLGRFNFPPNDMDFSGKLYEDDVNKCKYAKQARISWEGIDHLCEDVSFN